MLSGEIATNLCPQGIDATLATRPDEELRTPKGSVRGTLNRLTGDVRSFVISVIHGAKSTIFGATKNTPGDPRSAESTDDQHALRQIKAVERKLAALEQGATMAGVNINDFPEAASLHERANHILGKRKIGKRKSGFTIVELLVVTGIIAILIALILPAVQAAREAARRTQCSNNLRQVALATLNYEMMHKVLPPNGFWRTNAYLGGVPREGHSAFVHILPQLGQQPIYDTVDFNLPSWFSNGRNIVVADSRVETLECPSDDVGPVEIPYQYLLPSGGPTPDKKQYLTSYGWNDGTHFSIMGTLAALPGEKEKVDGVVCMDRVYPLAAVTDGTSNTFLVGERAQKYSSRFGWRKWWNVGNPQYTGFTTLFPLNFSKKGRGATAPSYPKIGVQTASSAHPGGGNFANLDGSVRFISEDVDSWPIKPNGWEPEGLPSWPWYLMNWQYPPRIGVYQALSTRSGGEVIGDY